MWPCLRRGLFRLSVLLMQAFSSNKSDFIPLVNDLGLYYQVVNSTIHLPSLTLISSPLTSSLVSTPAKAALQ